MSDANEDLVQVFEAPFPGTMWQKCQTNLLRGALDLVRNAESGTACEDLRMAPRG